MPLAARSAPASPLPAPLLISADEAARLLGCSRRTINNLVRDRGLPAIKTSAGGRLQFRPRDLEDWIDHQQAAAPPILKIKHSEGVADSQPSSD